MGTDKLQPRPDLGPSNYPVSYHEPSYANYTVSTNYANISTADTVWTFTAPTNGKMKEIQKGISLMKKLLP